jgi:hypothetical protein
MIQKRFNGGDYSIAFKTRVSQEFFPAALILKTIGQTEVEDGNQYLMGRQGLIDCATSAAEYNIVLQCHQQIMVGSQFEEQFLIEGFDKTHVGDGGVIVGASGKGFLKQATE